jgi:glycosyltransferase involved in cell wall biosynthesis
MLNEPGSRPLHVLLVAYYCRPDAGSEHQTGWGWVRALAARPGLRVTVVTAAANRAALEPAAAVLGDHVGFVYVDDRRRGADRLPAELPATARYLAFIRRGTGTARRLHQRDPVDVAHHVSWGNVRLGSPAFALDGVPVVFGPVGGGQVLPWRFLPTLGPGPAAVEAARNTQVVASRFSRATRRRLQTAAVVVATNEPTEQLARRLGARRVERMLDTAIDRPLPAPGRRHGGRLELLWLSRLLPRKGVGLAIAAVQRAAEQGADVHLTVAGDGPDRGRVAAAVAAGAPVTAVGQIPFERLPETYRRADVVLVTSLRDSGSPPMLDCLAFGVPALALDHHGAREFARGGWAFTVPVTTPGETVERLARSIVELADDREAIGRRAAATAAAAAQLTWAGHACRAHRWYQEVVAG